MSPVPKDPQHFGGTEAGIEADPKHPNVHPDSTPEELCLARWRFVALVSPTMRRMRTLLPVLLWCQERPRYSERKELSYYNPGAWGVVSLEDTFINMAMIRLNHAPDDS